MTAVSDPDLPCLSVCWSGLHGSIAYSLLGGGVPIPEQRLCVPLNSVPLKFKVTTYCTCLISLPGGVRRVSPPPRSTPLHWSRLRPGTPPPPCVSRSRPLCRCLPRTPSLSTLLFPAPPLLLLLPPSPWLPFSRSPSAPTTAWVPVRPAVYLPSHTGPESAALQ